VGEDRSQASHRVTVAEASEILGISVEAVRGRIKRNTLRAEHTAAGVFVLLDADQTTTGQQPDADRAGDQSGLIEEMRARIEDLREQLVEEREARRRADTIIAQLSAATAEQARTIRALEPPAPPESPEPREEPEIHPVRPERAEPAEPVDPRREEPERVQPERAEPERVEPQESPVTAADEQQGRGPVPGPEGPQESAQRPWWRRVFGG
jgi:hypothetical protein